MQIFKKTVNILSAYNDRVTWNVEKSGFQINFEKFWLIKYSVRVILDTQSSRFRARVAERRPAFRDRITRGSLESKIVYRKVDADLGKTENIFSAHRVTWNAEKIGL